MPTLGGQKTEKLILPSSTPEDEAWAIVQTNLPAKNILDLPDEQLNQSQQKTSLTLVTKGIIEWNFADAEGKVVPITEENVSQLAIKDFAAIVDAMGLQAQLSDLKKNQSQSTS